jgi:type I restriction enzyme, R subunit
LQNDDLSEDFCQILEDENLDDAQQEKLERHFATEMQVITRDDRLETIARDIVQHFPARGYLGKGLVVAVDKFTAVKLYDKVQRLWLEELKALRARIAETGNDVEKQRLKKRLEWMHKVQMAVVLSEEAKEDEKFAAKKLNITQHRTRMNALDANGQDIEGNFKDPAHPLQLVFVCAMWLTGFDVPSLSTLYLDKPMKDHTLMQTIARANRVTPWQINGVEKRNGEIVDYYNVFRNMRKALRDYALGGDATDEPPVRDKDALLALLDDAITQAFAFCTSKEIDLRQVTGQGDAFVKVALFNDFSNKLLAKDDDRKAFNVFENTVSALYEACKPEVLGKGNVRSVAALAYLRGVVEAQIGEVSIESAARRVAELLDESVVVSRQDQNVVREYGKEYKVIREGKTWDLSKIDFDKLRQDFGQTVYKNIETADLRRFIESKLALMLQANRARAPFAQRFLAIIESYNAGGTTSEHFFDQLVRFTQDLRDEDARHLREGLSDDELELFDLLAKDKMTQAETQKVKLAAKALLARLKAGSHKVLVQDWYKSDQTRIIVRSAVTDVLDRELPLDGYDRVLFLEKCNNVYNLALDYAAQGLKWAA